MIVIDNSNNNIIEIKSSWVKKSYNTIEELNSKRESAKKYIEEKGYNDFYLLEERDLKLLGPFNQRIHLLSIMIKNKHILLHNGKVQNYSNMRPNYIKALEWYNKWNLLK